MRQRARAGRSSCRRNEIIDEVSFNFVRMKKSMTRSGRAAAMGPLRVELAERGSAFANCGPPTPNCSERLTAGRVTDLPPFQTTFHRCPKGRVVVDNVHEPLH